MDGDGEYWKIVADGLWGGPEELVPGIIFVRLEKNDSVGEAMIILVM